ncbi:MAG: hypothetical protein ACTSWQ_00485 [Candidatus Thorarchaeota archaeon]
MMCMEPPEPTCPRCREYISEDDQKYCPHCWAEMDFTEIDFENPRGIPCPDCDKYVALDDIAWRCHNCGYDGTEQKCVACNKVLGPREQDLCIKCMEAEIRQQMKDPSFWDEFDDYCSESEDK